MKRYLESLFWVAVILVVALLTTLLFVGCATQTANQLPATGSQAIIKIVTQMNWPVTLGMILVVIGVMTGINGSTKFMAWIGGGLTLIALAGIVGAFFAILADYSGWIFGVGIAIGVVAFLHGSADIDGNGKISWNDFKALFKWKGK